ncbi:MAG: nicotinate-nucleotide diphosphorylase (carboxylating), partial [Desulfosarcina sp.]|nr:nicotinate-nucleotide diphosphorylase (carboxylating) [Desulfobacterales bacterium]
IELAKTGVDIISSGALTHSARCVDISMRIDTSKI